ncbi:MAG: hypothetical protein ACYSWU_01895 [Planctomycetota bacterium]|jgi:hypothetical protein
MGKKRMAKRKTVKKRAKKAEDSLKELSKLSKEELLIKLGQLMSENAALRQKAKFAAETTEAFRSAARRHLRQPFEDRMRDYED